MSVRVRNVEGNAPGEGEVGLVQVEREVRGLLIVVVEARRLQEGAKVRGGEMIWRVPRGYPNGPLYWTW